MSFIKMPTLGDALLAAMKKSGVKKIETTATNVRFLEAEAQPASIIMDQHKSLPKKNRPEINSETPRSPKKSYNSPHHHDTPPYKKIYEKYSATKIRINTPATTQKKQFKSQDSYLIDHSVCSSTKTISPKKETKIDKGYDLRIKTTTDLAWNPKYKATILRCLLLTNALPQDDQSKKIKDDYELNLGIDFGTSSTKVIISDKANKTSFAVSFFDTQGIEQYLMPSRVYQTDDFFYLDDGKQIHQRLKLNFLDDVENQDHQQKIVVFLGYIIRHAINWLKNTHSYYNNYQIIWRLTVGIPVASSRKTNINEKMTCLSIAAWRLAHQSCSYFSKDAISLATKYGNQLHQGKIEKTYENIEIYVVPELAAQIHGYVTSDSFDPKAANNFLLVDVGAGTVDTALFNVRREKGKWKFTWYTSSVEHHGTMNFNYDRLDWLCDALNTQKNIDASEVIAKIKQLMQMTDIQIALPNYISEYLSDCTIEFKDSKKNPDENFFVKKIKKQIVKDTFIKARDDNFLSEADLRDIPTYLCGGGMRLFFYKKLENKLSEQQSGYTWLKMSPRHINLPENLRAPSLLREDYDRLSVAYGLSLIELGNTTDAHQLEPQSNSHKEKEHSNYVDKDQT